MNTIDLNKEKEIEMLLEHIRLTNLAEQYKKYIKLIEQDKQSFVVENIKFSTSYKTEDMEIDPYKPIHYTYIREGLKDALANIQMEIDFIEDEFRKIRLNN